MSWLLPKDWDTDASCVGDRATPSRSALRREDASRGASDGTEAMMGMAFLLRCSLAFWTSEAVGSSVSAP